MRFAASLKILRPSTLVGKAKSGYGTAVYETKFRLRPRYLANFHGRSLTQVSGRSALPGKPVIGVVPYYGNEALLPSFLDHYRRIGVDFFVFLDLSRGASLGRILSDANDIAIWKPPPSAALKTAPHWLNYLRRRYAVGRWCLSVEPTEFLVFPRYESRHIRDLLEILELEGRDHLYALVIDTYGDVSAPSDTVDGTPSTAPGVEDRCVAPTAKGPAVAAPPTGSFRPFEALPYFDAVGYAAQDAPRFRGVTTRGGLQRRTIFQREPHRSPPVNRIPLVKWGAKFCYVAGTRVVTPRHLNTAHAKWHLSPTGCLLRFALLDDPESLAIAGKVEASTFVHDGAVPAYPGLALLRDQALKHAGSVRYRTSQDLVDWGLMVPGQWF